VSFLTLFNKSVPILLFDCDSSATDNYMPLAVRSGDDEKLYNQLAAPHSYYNGTDAQLNH
jgi:hypothetical protein